MVYDKLSRSRAGHQRPSGASNNSVVNMPNSQRMRDLRSNSGLENAVLLWMRCMPSTDWCCEGMALSMSRSRPGFREDLEGECVLRVASR